MYKSVAPLFEALRRYDAMSRTSFHTPGHKGLASPLRALGDVLRLDLTELPETGSLFDPSGPIAKAEALAASLFGACATLFSAGGCTLCIQAMLRLAAPRGGTVVAGRMIHRSALHAMALLGITPVWVLPRPDAGAGLPGRIHPGDVEVALRGNKGARAVYITSPDYYGLRADIPAIAAVCRRYDVPLLVDNAHGAHLGFVQEQSLHPLAQGAAMTADSAHKTLPVMTGGAFLQIGDRRFAADAKSAMALFGSTSPSFPVLASLDLCRAWLREAGKEAFFGLCARVEALYAEVTAWGYIRPAGPCDPARITLGCSLLGLTGQELAGHLRAFGVEPEYADDRYVILIPSPMNTSLHFDLLTAALRAAPRREPLLPRGGAGSLPHAAASPREALMAPSELLETERAIGRVASETACPCPPGIPLVIPGERIDREAARALAQNGIDHIRVMR